ncbi:MAG TPA: hypothetical protein VEI97_07465 [bacterium]|nr:hypothetical protein [bacterium]
MHNIDWSKITNTQRLKDTLLTQAGIEKGTAERAFANVIIRVLASLIAVFIALLLGGLMKKTASLLNEKGLDLPFAPATKGGKEPNPHKGMTQRLG